MNSINPIQRALGKDWEKLPQVIRDHYSPVGRLKLSGRMDEVWHPRIVAPFVLVGQVFNALVPYRGQDVPTTTYNWLDDEGEQFHFLREFSFPGKPVIKFPSRMEYYKNDEVIEYVRFGMGLRLRLRVGQEKLIFEIMNYVFDLRLFKVHVPGFLMLGNGIIVESSLPEKRGVRVEFELKHPIYGRTFSYSGDFILGEWSERQVKVGTFLSNPS